VIIRTSNNGHVQIMGIVELLMD